MRLNIRLAEDSLERLEVEWLETAKAAGVMNFEEGKEMAG